MLDNIEADAIGGGVLGSAADAVDLRTVERLAVRRGGVDLLLSALRPEVNRRCADNDMLLNARRFDFAHRDELIVGWAIKCDSFGWQC